MRISDILILHKEILKIIYIMNYDYPFNKFLKDIGPEKEKPS